MSAFGGKADVIHGPAKCPLIAISGDLTEKNCSCVTADTGPKLPVVAFATNDLFSPHNGQSDIVLNF